MNFSLKSIQATLSTTCISTMPSTMDILAINTIRTLAADVVQKANSGHPGAPMGCAPMAHVLFSNFICQDPQHPDWISRDRFVLSNGHGCVLQYIMLHMLGYNLSMDDLKSFRQLNSRTPGHPEANHGVHGIEVSTGPLGQGISNAVGLAMAEAHMAATFNRPGFQVISNYTYGITGDGCLQEGVQAEAVSLAGHLKLGNLIMLYDDNHITIDGDIEVGFTEDVVQRFESYGWHTQVLGDGDNDVAGIIAAIQKAKAVTDKPSLIKIRTTIGFGSVLQGEEKVHGSPLGAKDIIQLKIKFGLDPEVHFHVSDEVYKHYHDASARGAAGYNAWVKLMQEYAVAHPDLASELNRRLNNELPTGWKDLLPKYTPADPAVATRKLSENVLNKIALSIPELVGGSADLTGSNLTRWKGAVDFQPDVSGLGSYAGRYIRFGVREHGMAAICNGMNAYGGIIPFGATFFNFISYALGAVRLSALSKHQVIYIMTHDSIGLGEDGPTHQPIETLASLRALPNLITLRPADGNETSGAYVAALENRHRPSVLIFTRQNLPQLEGSTVEKTLKGAYVLSESANAKITLVGTGSEVSLAVDTAAMLAKEGIQARVVSMPSWELFEDQSHEYRASVFLDNIPTLSMEAMTTLGWSKYAHASCGIDTFGASAPYLLLYKKFGLVPEAVSEKAKKVIEYYKTRTPESKMSPALF
ncbi:Transketolase [Batrachochytrium dendrobatidis]